MFPVQKVSDVAGARTAFATSSGLARRASGVDGNIFVSGHHAGQGFYLHVADAWHLNLCKTPDLCLDKRNIFNGLRRQSVDTGLCLRWCEFKSRRLQRSNFSLYARIAFQPPERISASLANSKIPSYRFRMM